MIALLFPGQGSQGVGMGRDVAERSAAARAVYESVDEALGFSLSRLCFEGPEDELVRTEIQQPAILTTSIAILRALEEQGADLSSVAYVAGHSLGEYSALVASGALAITDAASLVNLRGRFMQEAVPQGEGAMAALVGCDLEAVERACLEARESTALAVAAANLNAPGQIVISGASAAVDAACERAKALGAKRAISLPVSAPFHCELMEPAARRLADALSGISIADPKPPVMTNVEAAPNDSATRVAELLTEQVTAPVRFIEMIEGLRDLGVTGLLEVGPGRVLSGLVARIDRKLGRGNVGSAEELDAAVAFLAAG